MNVLTRTLRHLTVDECGEVTSFRRDCTLAKDYPEDDCIDDLNDYPEIIQEWYSEWLRDDHYPLSPVDKDHAEDLWLKFCEEVGR